MRTITYRRRLYDKYVSRVKNDTSSLDAAQAHKWGKSYVRYLRGWLPKSPEAPILDVGCGAGWMLHFLANRGYRNLHGVDISGEQVALSRQVIESVHHGDALEYLDARTKRFDLVLALDVLEHFTKSETLPFLRACMAALRPGGRLIIQTPNPESPHAAGVIFGDFTHEQALAPAAISGLLRLCGFREIAVREAGPVPHGFISLWRWLAWRVWRLGMLLGDYIETGGPGSGICTRVYFATGVKSNDGF